MNRITKGFFTESEAKYFEEHFFNFWPKNIDKRWFWMAFQALEKGGLTYFESDEEEMIVRERLVLLAVFYYEFCHHSAFHESEHFNYWDEEFINEVKKDISPNADDLLLEIKMALIQYFGDEQIVIDELWLNCTEGKSNTLIPFSKVVIENSNDNINKEDAEVWFFGWNVSIDNMEGISL